MPKYIQIDYRLHIGNKPLIISIKCWGMTTTKMYKRYTNQNSPPSFQRNSCRETQIKVLIDNPATTPKVFKIHIGKPTKLFKRPNMILRASTKELISLSWDWIASLIDFILFIYAKQYFESIIGSNIMRQKGFLWIITIVLLYTFIYQYL